ncbi:unnamed protein product, partial [Polarella glacialis]
DFWVNLRFTFGAFQLHRLYHAARMLRNVGSPMPLSAFIGGPEKPIASLLPGPDQDASLSIERQARAASDLMCSETFQSLIFVSTRAEEPGWQERLPLDELQIMIQHVGKNEFAKGLTKLRQPPSSAKDWISSQQFMELVWESCG